MKYSQILLELGLTLAPLIIAGLVLLQTASM